jgi:hypothetical protein
MKKFQWFVTVLACSFSATLALAGGEGSGSDLEGHGMFSTENVAVIVQQIQDAQYNGNCDLESLKAVGLQDAGLKTKAEVFEVAAALTTNELSCLRRVLKK